MASFAPVYNPPTSHQSFLTREQKRERKRKRDAGGDGDNDGDVSSDEQSPLPKDEDEDQPRVPHPVNKTDPYYVAGHPREQPLPRGNFPHAAIKEARQTDEVPIEEEIARLNPPLFVSKYTPQDKHGSLKRRHLDNLTAVLHQCMLRGDWKRASRTWGLILRTEVQGRGIDVRQNGRSLVGAELLMRRNQTLEQRQVRPPSSSSADSNLQRSNHDDDAMLPVISDEGFKTARDYYERLILQYPYLQRAPHSAINALAIYPALFNVWMYEVQSRADRARRKIGVVPGSGESDLDRSPGRDDENDAVERKKGFNQIRNQELQQAVPIAQRMDELVLNPPYDNSLELLDQRGNLALWLSEMHRDMSKIYLESLSGTSSDDDGPPMNRYEFRASKRWHEQEAKKERDKATKIFQQLADAKVDVPEDIVAFLQEDFEEVPDKEDSG
ncbi:hypothetical protein M409DRAFT_25361 [Zasmidium cellare ATCC 36951]|uniref:Uncharacterized protein n=1 Tax=Zasmidium cellare ATCC 36951 TaxID=1080233 RepID=A0A6A6CCK5_ZASCE|nr:uncharacterized protein M409DRAFT_25361 [Zasmidium cellare ATCC 36951]KAF2164483.1 hypothetical protein M409DRAFT_25361 [Zasmidium cellare ATCC 36951]